MDNTTTIYLIRHGDLEYPRNEKGQRLLYGPDVRLSDTGRAQIQRLAERLDREGRQLEQIYCSPFLRAVETSEIIAFELGLPKPIHDPRFQDISPGSMVGKLLDDVIAGRIQDYGETDEDVMQRMVQGVEEVVHNNQGRTIGIVSHGDAIRVLLFRLLHPEVSLPSIIELSKDDYLEKGEAWRLVVSPALRIVERKYIGRPQKLWGRGRRKS